MNEKPERLFFALSFSPKKQQQLENLASQIPGEGRAVPRTNLHLTLSFLGNVSPWQKVRLLAGAAKVKAPPVSLLFSQLGYRRRSQLVWISSTEIPDSLLALVQQLKVLAENQQIPQETRRFVAHVTLKRKVRRVPDLSELTPSIEVNFSHFGLYISEPVENGVRYRCLQSWPLSG